MPHAARLRPTRPRRSPTTGRRLHGSGRPLLLALLLALPATPALAESAAPSWPNPLTPAADGPPGRLSLELHSGSYLRDGHGAAGSVRPWAPLALKLAYGYGAMHLLSAQAQLELQPRAQLTPYLPLGYTLSLARLPLGLQLRKHDAFAGLGLRLRLLRRYFLAVDLTAAYTFAQTLHDGEDHHELPVTEAWKFQTGASVGAFFH